MAAHGFDTTRSTVDEAGIFERSRLLLLALEPLVGSARLDSVVAAESDYPWHIGSQVLPA
ncbi:unannotated protein [freshwater metagenome]|uniref:Unannotated protein n=1 Tax=freshwater metagenome TaxID=449393 RepID=A0A6J6NC74_9ZZZZ